MSDQAAKTAGSIVWFLKHGRKSEFLERGPHKGRCRSESKAGNVVTADTFAETTLKLAALEGTEADHV